MAAGIFQKFGKTLAIAALGLLGILSSPVVAQTRGDLFNGQVTVYGWGAGISGDLTPFTGAPTLSFDKSLSEVLEDLDAAFFVTGLARSGDLVFLGDLSYSSSSKAGLVPPGAPASGEFTQRSVTLAAGHRVLQRSDRAVDALIGLRAWRVEGQVSVPAAGVSVSPEKEFVDPIIALRGRLDLSPRWSTIGYLDIGGFGAGSELTYQVAVTANYQATENIYLSIGYRHLYLDYEDGGTAFEGSMTGPLLGVTWRF